MARQNNKKPTRVGGNGGKPNGAPSGPGRFFTPGGGFTSNLVSIVLIFLLLISAYTLVETGTKAKPVISLSQVANDIKAGDITAIQVSGNDLTLKYKDGTQKTSMKDPDDGLPETLVPYGVTPDELSQVDLTVSNESGFLYWFEALGPTLITLILFGVLLWFLTRQVRGAGMQAFTFGQSKARMIDPEDTNQRVTFADVAGAKEAKEELMEIVDFLKNPKKFLDIGARIPKGILLMGAPGNREDVASRALSLAKPACHSFLSQVLSSSRCSSASAQAACVICSRWRSVPLQLLFS